MDDQLLFSLLLFGVVAMVVFVVIRLLNRGGDSRLRERLSGKVREEKPTTQVKSKEVFQKLGQWAAKPFMPETREKQSVLRKKLGMAGIYSAGAIRTVTGCKVICLGVGLLGGYAASLVSDNFMLSVALGGLVGYLSPTLWLRLEIGKQQQGLEYGLPDALDLMVVCVEAGLAMDAAMQRVGQELNFVHPRLSRELEIAHMETVVGLSRTESLRNLGLRTGSASLQGLSSMLIQAERFGTSVASALRVHADSLRTARQHKAEEMAAKASVKMTFPLVLFIFPAVFIVLAGPTIIGLMNSSFFK